MLPELCSYFLEGSVVHIHRGLSRGCERMQQGGEELVRFCCLAGVALNAGREGVQDAMGSMTLGGGGEIDG